MYSEGMDDSRRTQTGLRRGYDAYGSASDVGQSVSLRESRGSEKSRKKERRKTISGGRRTDPRHRGRSRLGTRAPRSDRRRSRRRASEGSCRPTSALYEGAPEETDALRTVDALTGEAAPAAVLKVALGVDAEQGAGQAVGRAKGEVVMVARSDASRLVARQCTAGAGCATGGTLAGQRGGREGADEGSDGGGDVRRDAGAVARGIAEPDMPGQRGEV
jgi:hypothetical protein